MPVINMAATGAKIKELITGKGMAVRDIQKAFGFASPYPVYKWINGQSLPAVENLVVLAKIMDITVDDLLVVDIND